MDSDVRDFVWGNIALLSGGNGAKRRSPRANGRRKEFWNWDLAKKKVGANYSTKTFGQFVYWQKLLF